MLPVLRGLSLEDFGLLLISMPDDAYPALSSVLPRMASPEVQIGATGKAGEELLVQTISFARQLESLSIKYAGRSLRESTILDFGSGYGRNLRSMLYFSNPDYLWGVDAWASSLELARECNVPGHIELSDEQPTTLPVGDTKFDLAFAFSIFTHLSRDTAMACLAAIRKCIAPTGLLVATIRPVEFWEMENARHTPETRAQMIELHRSGGFAFMPEWYSTNSRYGDTSMDLDQMAAPGWRLAGYDSSLIDPYQIAAVLQPV